MLSLGRLVFLVSTLFVAEVRGHGAMQFPVTRNVYVSHYCPQCANGPSVCGSGGNSQWPADDSTAGLLSSTYTTPLTQLIAGGMVEIEAFFTAAHMGHFALELCANPGSQITEDCFVKLERDPTDTRYCAYADASPWAAILPVNECTTTFSSSKPLRIRFKVPDTVSDHAILRWYWQTGNSCDSLPAVQTPNAPASVKNWKATLNGKTCTAALTNSGNLCGTDCPNASCANEQFKNCADIQIINGDASTVVTSSNAATGEASGGSFGSDSGQTLGGGSNGGSEETGSDPKGSADSESVTACKDAVGSSNPAWDEDCKDKCEFYAKNPKYCKYSTIVECVKAIGYCG